MLSSKSHTKRWKVQKSQPFQPQWCSCWGGGKFELITWAFQKLMKLKHTYLTILICWTQKNYTQHTLEISLQTNQFLSQWNNWNCSIEFFATTKSWYASYSWREGLQNKVHVREGGSKLENAYVSIKEGVLKCSLMLTWGREGSKFAQIMLT